MNKPPRSPQEPILTNALLFRTFTVSLFLCIFAFIFFEAALQTGRSIVVARTIAVNVFVFGELFYLFNCRSLKESAFKIGFSGNPMVLIGVSLMILLQILFTYLPIMNIAFQSAPILLFDWLLILGSGLVIFLMIELEKKVQRLIAHK